MNSLIFEYGDIKIWLPKSNENIDVIITVLQNMKNTIEEDLKERR